MRRKRQVKKLGGSYAIHLTREDIVDFGLKEGDIVEIDDLIVTTEDEN